MQSYISNAKIYINENLISKPGTHTVQTNDWNLQNRTLKVCHCIGEQSWAYFPTTMDKKKKKIR